MCRSILVPLDGSKIAEHALPLALSIARRREGGSVSGAGTCSAPGVHRGVPAFNGPESEVREQERVYLQGLTQSLTRETAVTVNSAITGGTDRGCPP